MDVIYERHDVLFARHSAATVLSPYMYSAVACAYHRLDCSRIGCVVDRVGCCDQITYRPWNAWCWVANDDNAWAEPFRYNSELDFDRAIA